MGWRHDGQAPLLKNTFRGGKRRLRQQGNPTDINARVSWPRPLEGNGIRGERAVVYRGRKVFHEYLDPTYWLRARELHLLSLFNARVTRHTPPTPQFISPHCRLRSTPLINQPKEINIRLWLSPLPYGQIEIVVNAFVRTTEMEIVATGGRSNSMQFVARSTGNVSMKFSFFSFFFLNSSFFFLNSIISCLQSEGVWSFEDTLFPSCYTSFENFWT